LAAIVTIFHWPIWLVILNSKKRDRTPKKILIKIIEEIKAKEMFTIQLNDRKSSSEWRKIKVETELFAPKVILSLNFPQIVVRT